MRRRIAFVSGTRADFGKLKPLIRAVLAMAAYDVRIFATGMHMLARYGTTVNEITKCGFPHVHPYINQRHGDSMDVILSKTVAGLSDFVREEQPSLIIVHGDRVETLAGAIVGSLNNVRVAHVEGGEVSGTIDELIRHAVSKLSHLHFVANEPARDRLLQMGEDGNCIFVVGSPDLDVMASQALPSLEEALQHYAIPFTSYGIALFHPVTTEVGLIPDQARALSRALLASNERWVVVYPNNDHGSDAIVSEWERLRGNPRFSLFPSIRFEYFLTLLKHARCIVGNSSAGVREAPFYGVPTINVGTRQHGRAKAPTIVNVDAIEGDILSAIVSAASVPRTRSAEFGDGASAAKFAAIVSSDAIWSVPTQKVFVQRV